MITDGSTLVDEGKRHRIAFSRDRCSGAAMRYIAVAKVEEVIRFTGRLIAVVDGAGIANATCFRHFVSISPLMGVFWVRWRAGGRSPGMFFCALALSSPRRLDTGDPLQRCCQQVRSRSAKGKSGNVSRQEELTIKDAPAQSACSRHTFYR